MSIRSAQYMLAALVLLVLSVMDSSSEKHSPRLRGTFIQLTNEHFDWTQETWVRLFGYFKALGLKTLFVQWTAYDDIDFYRVARQDHPISPLETILRQADAHDMDVFVGLGHSSDYWRRILEPLDRRRAFLQALRESSLRIARELTPIVDAHDAFQGWYLCEEIDDTSWAGEQEQAIIVGHLADLTAGLRAIDPDARPVAISGFSNGVMTPDRLKRFWMEILAAAEIDLLLFQDGIGADKLELSQLEPYLAALYEATQTHSAKLDVIVELFELPAEASGSEAFVAHPASLKRIQAQMKIAAHYSTDLIAFSIPEYMTALGGAAPGRLYEKYRAQFMKQEP